MGDPSKTKKKYSRPRKPWDKTRLEKERELKKTYGLKNKRELWRVESLVRKKRQSARKLLALPLEKRSKAEQELLASLFRIGVLGKDASLDEVLGLELRSLLERRLQTLVVRKGLASTMNQARQFIVHGHISVNGKKVSSPSYIVTREDQIAYYGKPVMLSSLNLKETRKKMAEENATDANAGSEPAMDDSALKPTETTTGDAA